MTRMRLIPAALIALLCGCRSVPRNQCFPAKGGEVWIERHRQAPHSADGRSTLEVRFVPDTSRQRHGLYAQGMLFLSGHGLAPFGNSLHRDITVKSPATFKLLPGSYRLLVEAITYERVAHSVDVAADESVMVSVRLPGTAYCEETVTISETA